MLEEIKLKKKIIFNIHIFIYKYKLIYTLIVNYNMYNNE